MDFASYVTKHYDGQLTAGIHGPTDGLACALEAYHAWRGEPWSDMPNSIWDFRPLNDACWSSAAVRAQHLTPVIAAYADCTTWPLARQQAVVGQIVLLTVQQLVAVLPGLPDPVRQACRTVTTARAAWSAAEAAARAAEVLAPSAWSAASAAVAAAVAAAEAAVDAAAEAAAEAAAGAAETDAGAGDRPLITMCTIFLAATEEPV